VSGSQSQGFSALVNASVGGHVELVKLLLALPGLDYNHATNQVRIDVVFDVN
jgi:hypothetical protein